MFLHSSCVISWGIIPTNTMCQEISISLSLRHTSSNRYIICVPIIYISSCSAITRHTMDIIILIIQRVHIYFVLCNECRIERIIPFIAHTNNIHEQISWQISHSQTIHEQTSQRYLTRQHMTYGSQLSISQLVLRSLNRQTTDEYIIFYYIYKMALLSCSIYDTSHLSIVEIVRPNVYKRVKMPLLLLYRDGIVKLKMYWKIHKIY